MDPDSPINNPHELWDDAEVKARIGRRVVSRLRRTPGMFDGDGDGFVYNPRTGRDDMPAPRRSLIPRPGKRKRNILFNQPAPGQRQVMRNRWADEDDNDPLEELTRSLGIGSSNASDRMGTAAREMAERRRQQGAAFSPVDVDRKKFKIVDISRNDFLSLLDDLLDYTKTLKDNPLDERDNKRVWKLLFVMQKLENIDGITQDGNSINLNISEDELKRLFKGLESLIDNVEVWSENDKAQELYRQIRKMYKSGWGNVTIGKSSGFDDIEFKVLGARLGRRAARAIRRVGKRSRIDGDGDGFRTNPITGEDDVPVVDAPEIAKPKRNLTSADVGMMSIRGRGRMYETARRSVTSKPFRAETTDDDDDGNLSLNDLLQMYMSTPRTDREALQWLAESINQSEIKDRPWKIFEKRVNAIEQEIEDKFGKLTSRTDFKKAFEKVHNDIEISGFDEDLSEEEKGFFKGLLWMMEKFPNRFDRTSTVDIVKPDEGREAGGAGTLVNPRYDIVGSDLDVYPGERITFEFYGDESHRDKSNRPQHLIDGVSNQLMKAYLKSKAQEEDPSTLVARMKELQGLGVGIHEAVHAIHHLAAHEEALPNIMDADQIKMLIDDLINNDPDEIWENQQFIQAHFTTENALMTLIRVRNEPPNAFQIMEAMRDQSRADGNDKEADEMQEAIFARAKAIDDANRFVRVITGPNAMKYQNISSALSGANPRSESEAKKVVGKLFFDNREEAIELITEIMADEVGATPQEVRDAFRGSYGEYTSASFQMSRRKLWDDLNATEIAALRQIWKYVSKYAKDKNSYYSGTSLGSSMEGAAEGMLLRIMGFGLPPDKVSPEAIAALDKWLSWMAGKDYL